MRQYVITSMVTLVITFVIWLVFMKEDTVTATGTRTVTATGTETATETETETETETDAIVSSRSNEQTQSTSASVRVERGPEGCPTTKGFLEQVCTMDGVTFERMKGVTFRRYTARDPMVTEGWGPDELKTCIDMCKEDDDCKGVSVRSEGFGENSRHHCTFHTNLDSTKDGAQYRSYCLDDVEKCSGEDIVTDQDSQYWG